jgi:hypothetical protein
VLPLTKIPGVAQPQNGVNLHGQQITGLTGDILPNAEGTLSEDGAHGITPSSLMAEMTGWGEFDSLVTAGMGLDFAFMGDEHTEEWNRAMDGVGILPP